MSEIRVRPMTAADLNAVLAIERETPEAPHWRPAEYEASLQPPGNSPLHHAAFVAESTAVETGSRLLGFVMGRLLLDGEENVCELESIAVRRAERRSGVGEKLFRALAAWAEGLGARRLHLEVRIGNAAAIRLYERQGMVRNGQRPRYYTAPDEDALLMGKDLSGSVAAVEKSPENPVEDGPPGC